MISRLLVLVILDLDLLWRDGFIYGNYFVPLPQLHPQNSRTLYNDLLL